MSDFLTRLASRQLGQITTIEPRVAPLYGAAKEPQNFSLTEDAEYRSEVQPREILESEERTPRHAAARTDALPGQTPRHASREHVGEIMGQAVPFTAEGSAACPARSSPTERLDLLSPRSEPEAERLPQRTTPVVPIAQAKPVGPFPLVNQIQSEPASRLNEFPAPAGSRSLQNPFRDQPQKSEEPSVYVTIGRIEVRATTPPVPSQKQRPAPKTMSLDEYLGKRNGGAR